MKWFCLSKDAFSYVLEQITPELSTNIRTTSVPPILKLASSLRFLAEGSYQTSAGNDFNIGLAQQTVSKVFAEVLNAAEKVLRPIWISLTMTDMEKSDSKRFFYNTYGFPGVVGAIDGSHIQMMRPTTNEHVFFNRKLQHSVNAMVVSKTFKFNFFFIVMLVYNSDL